MAFYFLAARQQELPHWISRSEICPWVAKVCSSAPVNATDLVLDRIPPIVYDALYVHAYRPDPFLGYEPHLDYLPNPYEGFRAYLPAVFQH